jgi:hypothetical protein
MNPLHAPLAAGETETVVLTADVKVGKYSGSVSIEYRRKGPCRVLPASDTGAGAGAGVPGGGSSFGEDRSGRPLSVGSSAKRARASADEDNLLAKRASVDGAGAGSGQRERAVPLPQPPSSHPVALKALVADVPHVMRVLGELKSPGNERVFFVGQDVLALVPGLAVQSHKASKERALLLQPFASPDEVALCDVGVLQSPWVGGQVVYSTQVVFTVQGLARFLREQLPELPALRGFVSELLPQLPAAAAARLQAAMVAKPAAASGGAGSSSGNSSALSAADKAEAAESKSAMLVVDDAKAW